MYGYTDDVTIHQVQRLERPNEPRSSRMASEIKLSVNPESLTLGAPEDLRSRYRISHLNEVLISVRTEVGKTYRSGD